MAERQGVMSIADCTWRPDHVSSSANAQVCAHDVQPGPLVAEATTIHGVWEDLEMLGMSENEGIFGARGERPKANESKLVVVARRKLSVGSVRTRERRNLSALFGFDFSFFRSHLHQV